MKTVFEEAEQNWDGDGLDDRIDRVWLTNKRVSRASEHELYSLQYRVRSIHPTAELFVRGDQNGRLHKIFVHTPFKWYAWLTLAPLWARYRASQVIDLYTFRHELSPRGHKVKHCFRRPNNTMWVFAPLEAPEISEIENDLE